eukprot:scaffold34129_cov32-Tisochrysis_lutea.AAC.2
MRSTADGDVNVRANQTCGRVSPLQNQCVQQKRARRIRDVPRLNEHGCKTTLINLGRNLRDKHHDKSLLLREQQRLLRGDHCV